jgi:hypothetical protein
MRGHVWKYNNTQAEVYVLVYIRDIMDAFVRLACIHIIQYRALSGLWSYNLRLDDD